MRQTKESTLIWFLPCVTLLELCPILSSQLLQSALMVTAYTAKKLLKMQAAWAT